MFNANIYFFSPSENYRMNGSKKVDEAETPAGVEHKKMSVPIRLVDTSGSGHSVMLLSPGVNIDALFDLMVMGGKQQRMESVQPVESLELLIKLVRKKKGKCNDDDAHHLSSSSQSVHELQ